MLVVRGAAIERTSSSVPPTYRSIRLGRRIGSRSRPRLDGTLAVVATLPPRPRRETGTLFRTLEQFEHQVGARVARTNLGGPARLAFGSFHRTRKRLGTVRVIDTRNVRVEADRAGAIVERMARILETQCPRTGARIDWIRRAFDGIRHGIRASVTPAPERRERDEQRARNQSAPHAPKHEGRPAGAQHRTSPDASRHALKRAAHPRATASPPEVDVPPASSCPELLPPTPV